MRIVHSPDEIGLHGGGQVGLVPTMGAFHEGHMELMRQAKAACDHVVVSLFVNPTQFGANEDFDLYPRDLARDAALAESVGVDVLYCPSVATMYPRRTTEVFVHEVTEGYEGDLRPGHFTGVATVVLKLFNMVRPHVAFFGQKDLQQCAVIRRMVEDLNVPLELRFVETLREPDGLAMSSRNVYLSASERALAPSFYRSLLNAATDLSSACEPSACSSIVARTIDTLADAGFSVDYVALVDQVDFRPLSLPNSDARLIGAVKIGNIRLIDNVPILGR